MRRAAPCLIVLLAAWSLAPWALRAAEPIPGIGPAGEVEKLEGGLQFCEGPADDGQGNLYFTDIPAAKILRLDSQGNLTTFSDESGHANGLMFGPAGQLYACEMDGQLAVWDVASKTRQVAAAQFEGYRFNAPNDLVIDAQGGVYFTDPYFRAPNPLPQGTMGVYYLDPQGKVSRVLSNQPVPNGILLSLNEQTLYVLPSGSNVMLAYRVEEPGSVGTGRDFCTLATGNAGSGADGGALDTAGNLYITSERGIEVFSPAGEALGIIEVPEQPANCTFGGPDRKTLYITARTSLYAAPMEVAGHRYGDSE